LATKIDKIVLKSYKNKFDTRGFFALMVKIKNEDSSHLGVNMINEKKDHFAYYFCAENMRRDMEFEKADDWIEKARCVAKVVTLIENEKMFQNQITKNRHLQDQEVNWMNNQFETLTVDNLMHFLMALDYDIEIRIYPKVASPIPIEADVSRSKIKSKLDLMSVMCY